MRYLADATTIGLDPLRLPRFGDVEIVDLERSSMKNDVQHVTWVAGNRSNAIEGCFDGGAFDPSIRPICVFVFGRIAPVCDLEAGLVFVLENFELGGHGHTSDECFAKEADGSTKGIASAKKPLCPAMLSMQFAGQSWRDLIELEFVMRAMFVAALTLAWIAPVAAEGEA